MELDKHEISGLKDILNELNENIADYEKRKETGNSKGEHKDIYRGKFEAYNRCRTILYRYLKWHSIIDVMSDGGYHFLKDAKCNKHIVNGWHLFKEKKPTEGDNIEIYYDDRTIVNVDWQDCLIYDKEFKHMRFWRACR